MRVHLVGPSNHSFGIAFITPRWLFVLAAATPERFGEPLLTDEALDPIDPETIQPGDIVGIGLHSGNARRGYEIGKMARQRGATVIYGGIHATIFPEEPFEHGEAHAVVKGDGDFIWGKVLDDAVAGNLQRTYDGGKVEGENFLAARWDLLPEGKYMWASVQTVRGCPKHCSFCSVWRTDGQRPRQRRVDSIIGELITLRRKGFRFIALADDNFYPVGLEDLRLAEIQEAETLKKTGELPVMGSSSTSRLADLQAVRAERFELLERMAQLPKDMIFFTQITMEAAEDVEFLRAMNKARIRGALVGVESVTEEGLKSVYKDFNSSGDDLVTRLKAFRENNVHVLGSFIFGLPGDTPESFSATVDLAQKADIALAQFVILTPFPGTVDFERWEKEMVDEPTRIDGFPLTRHWLIPQHKRPKLFSPHPSMSHEQISSGTQGVWDTFYSWRLIWERSKVVPTLRGRVAFLVASKLFRQMYAGTGLSTDSARAKRASTWARMSLKPARRLFQSAPMPDLQMPAWPQ
jgi:radical SAM superfamily enzyme YgiQ (UPF0313 family)